jgi:hypothetical protein
VDCPRQPSCCFEIVARIEEKVMRLENPELKNMGRSGLVEGTRELVEYPHIIVYRVDEARGEIGDRRAEAIAERDEREQDALVGSGAASLPRLGRAWIRNRQRGILPS